MPSIFKACAALLGAVAAAQALPGALYSNTSSPVPIEQSKQTSSHDIHTSRPLASPTLVPFENHHRSSPQATQPSTTALPSTPVASSAPTTQSHNRMLSPSSSGATHATQSPTASGSHTTLLPDVHWTFDTKPAENVKPILPGEASRMFYGNADAAKPGAFAFVSYYFTSHSVNLDHSDHVSFRSAGPGGLAVTFSSQEAFQHASSTWSAKQGLILIAYAKGCGDYEKGQRCYFDVSSLEVDASSGARTIVARGQAKHPDHLTSRGHTEWGWWSPRTGPAGSAPGFSWNAGPASAPGSGSGTGSNGGNQAPARAPCAAPLDAKYGLPTACLGEHFDLDLDNSLGYEPLSDKSRALLNELAPGLNLGAAAGHGWNQTVSRRHQRHVVVKRGFWSTVWADAKTFVAGAYEAVVNAAKFSGSIDRQFSWALPNPGNQSSEANKLVDVGARQVVSPWGNAVLLKSFGSREAEEGGLAKHLNIFCVDCGATGKASVAGKVSWSLAHGITEGSVEFTTDMHFGLKLGVDADMHYKSDFSAELLRHGLPGLSYGVVTVAPQVSVSARVELEAAARGRLLAGAEMGVLASRVVVDIVNSSRSEKSGWEPYLRPVLEAEGEIILSASLALPFGLECGVSISQWHKTVAIIEEPSISAIAQAAAAMSLPQAGSFSAGFRERDGCTGISTQIAWRNRVFVNVVDLKVFGLHDTGHRALARECLALPAYKEPSKAIQSKLKRWDPSVKSVVDLTSKYPAHGSRDVTSAPDKYVTSAPDKYVISAPEHSAHGFTSAPEHSAHGFTSAPEHSAHGFTSAPEHSAHGFTSEPSYSDVNGFNYTRLLTLKGKAKVLSCSNGNLYAAGAEDQHNTDCSELFPVGRNDVIASDGTRRLMYYDTAAMSRIGVSRLRFSADGRVTRSGAIVVLGLYADPSTPDKPYYLAVDADGKVLYLIVCDFADGSGPKVFLASDPEKGIHVLESDHVQYSVTGGAVAKCYPLIVSGGASKSRSTGDFELNGSDSPTSPRSVSWV